MTDFDTSWKQATSLFLKDLMDFHFPQFSEQIDWSYEPESLEQELDALTPEHYMKDGVTDKLFKIRLKNGKEHFAFLHAEIQSKKPDFEERMAKYMIRLFDKYGPRVFSVAILIDKNKHWNPNQYAHEFWGCEIIVKYQTVKILDYIDRVQELEASNNPFALVMLIHVLAWQKDNIHKRLQLKQDIAKILIRKKFGVKYTKALLNFLDFLIQLPKPEEKKYYGEIKTYDEELETMYIPAYMEEKIEIAKAEGKLEGKLEGKAEGKLEGRAEGVQIGEAQMLLNLLNLKFGSVSNDVREKINRASEAQLTQWATKIFAAQTIEEMLQ